MIDPLFSTKNIAGIGYQNQSATAKFWALGIRLLQIQDFNVAKEKRCGLDPAQYPAKAPDKAFRSRRWQWPRREAAHPRGRREAAGVRLSFLDNPANRGPGIGMIFEILTR